MKIFDKNNTLNLDFENDSAPDIKMFKDMYGSHIQIGNVIYGDFPEVKKIEDYLYEITVDDMDEDFLHHILHPPFGGACSEARNGNIICRSYDWFFDSKTSFIVKVPKKGNRHASIGVASVSIMKDEMDRHQYNELFKVLPYETLDGINDCGVYCGTNVVPTGDKGITTGTNPGKKDLPNIAIPRFVLNNASTADEAVELLKNMNIFSTQFDGNQIELHTLIADAEKTYIVEFVNNQISVIPYDNFQAVMTNFYHTDWNGEVKAVFLGDSEADVKSTGLTNHAEGLERYDILSQGLSSVTDLSSAMTLIKNVDYTKTYSEEWLSECVGTTKTFGDLTIYNKASDFDGIMTLMKSMYENRDRSRPDTWQSVHTSCYDLQNKTMVVRCQEGANVYNYSLEVDE